MMVVDKRYDENGNAVYYNVDESKVTINEYDENNNLIRTKCPSLDLYGEYEIEYDEKGRKTLYRDYFGSEQRYWYFEEGSKVERYRRGKLISTTYYDKDDNVTHCYDERGNLVFHKDGDCSEYLDYDKKDRLIKTSDSNDKSDKYEYNEDGALDRVVESIKGKKTKEIIYEYEGIECIRSTDIFYNEDGTTKQVVKDTKEKGEKIK